MPDDLPAARDQGTPAARLRRGVPALRNSSRSTSRIYVQPELYVWIAAAKNDPRKQGRELYVPRLLAISRTPNSARPRPSNAGSRRFGATGPLFRTFNLRGRLTENRLGVAGDFAEHSLRRGFHYQRREEEGRRQEQQASDGSTLERNCARLRRDGHPGRRSAAAQRSSGRRVLRV
jgi:hypothetical protein